MIELEQVSLRKIEEQVYSQELEAAALQDLLAMDRLAELVPRVTEQVHILSGDFPKLLDFGLARAALVVWVAWLQEELPHQAVFQAVLAWARVILGLESEKAELVEVEPVVLVEVEMEAEPVAVLVVVLELAVVLVVVALGQLAAQQVLEQELDWRLVQKLQG